MIRRIVTELGQQVQIYGFSNGAKKRPFIIMLSKYNAMGEGHILQNLKLYSYNFMLKGSVDIYPLS